jgi:hypothetical protein
MSFKTLKPGQVLSETQYYIVEKISGKKAQLKTDSGESVILDEGYIDKCTSSAHEYSSTKRVSRTEMANIFMSNANTAMTVSFNKQVKSTEAASFLLKYRYSSEAEFKKKVKEALEGEERTMIGRHSGSVDEFGRIRFVDMEVEKTAGDYDSRFRLVDPRSINYLIVQNTRYETK